MKHDTDKSRSLSNFLAPRYWPTWLGIGLLRASALLPLRFWYRPGAALGLLAYYLLTSRRRVAMVNLRQAFPDYSEAQLEHLCRQSFKSVGISVFEMAAAWFKPHDKLLRLCRIEGQEHLQAAMADNRGALLLTGHFSTLELGALFIGSVAPKYNGVYKPAHNPLFNAVMVHGREKMGNKLIETRDVRSIIRGLKSGHATWFGPDQDFADQDIVFTPFLGGTASTLTATAKLARMTGCAVVPFYPERLENGKGYRLHILPALENFPGDDIEADSARVNKTIEEMVYRLPQQYLWSHKRFKTQSDRSTNIYAGKAK